MLKNMSPDLTQPPNHPSVYHATVPELSLLDRHVDGLSLTLCVETHSSYMVALVAITLVLSLPMQR